MIIDGNKTVRKVNGITKKQEQEILNFLQGAIYCWCKNKKSEWFALRDLMGRENFLWKGTPMMVLYEKHLSIKSHKNAVRNAGQDAGWLLKKAIHRDIRKFKFKYEALTNNYKWETKN